MQQTSEPTRTALAARVGGVMRDVASGGVVAFLLFVYSLSFTLLLFSGPLIGAAPRGMAIMLLSGGLATVVVAATSGFRIATAGPDTATVAVLAALLTGLAAGAAPGTTTQQLEILAVVALAGTTSIIGIMLLVFGILRLGIWIRYVPFPVVGGFLSASGVMLVLGAIRLLTGETVSLERLPDPAQMRVALPMSMAVCVAAVLALSRARWKHPMVLPAMLLMFGVLIDGGLWVLGVAPSDARALGLIMGNVPVAKMGWAWGEVAATSVDLRLLLHHATEVAVATSITAIAILLYATGLEVSEKTQVDLDHELRANGIANLLVGACGGIVCTISLNRSQAIRASGGRSRLAGIIAGGLCLLSIVVGPTAIQWVPLPIIAGLLLYLGIQLIWQWVILATPRLSLLDTVLVVAIPVIAVRFGYLEAAGVGVVAACIIFAVKYSRIRVVKHDLTRREYGSYVERSPEQLAFLKQNGDLIRILWIQGYLFFGTANRLYESSRARLSGSEGRSIHFLLLDLSNVTGIDSSSVYSFVKLADRVREHGATLVVSGLSDDVREAFSSSSFFNDHADRVEFPQMGRALEWAEEQLLGNAHLGAPSEQSFAAWLGAELRDPRFADRITDYLEAIDLAPDAELFRQGDAADSLYLLESGRLSIVLHRQQAETIRLRSICGHTVVGEMGLYRGLTRAASVIADQPSRVHRLTRADLARLEHEEPELGSAFHSLMVRVLADRLGFATTEIAALQR